MSQLNNKGVNKKQMRIFCYFSGSTRLSTLHVRQNILTFKEVLKDYTVDYCIVTDKHEEFFFDVEYLSDLGEILIVPRVENCSVTQNGHSTVSTMYYRIIQDHIKEREYDYVIKIRNDMTLVLANIYRYFNGRTYVLPRYWWNTDPLSLENENFLIIPFVKFAQLDFSQENVDCLAPLMKDTEQLIVHLTHPTAIIDPDDIVDYCLFGTLKFHVRGKRTLFTSIPPQWMLFFFRR